MEYRRSLLEFKEFVFREDSINHHGLFRSRLKFSTTSLFLLVRLRVRGQSSPCRLGVLAGDGSLYFVQPQNLLS